MYSLFCNHLAEEVRVGMLYVVFVGLQSMFYVFPCSDVGWSGVCVGLRYFLIILTCFGKEHSLRLESFQYYQGYTSIITPTLNLFTTLLLTRFSQMEFSILINLTCTFPFSGCWVVFFSLNFNRAFCKQT